MALQTASGTTRPRADLAGLLETYSRNLDNLIGLKLSPYFGVPTQDGRYYSRTKADVAVPSGPRAPGTSFERQNFVTTQTTYQTIQYALEGAVPVEQQNEYGSVFDVELATGESLAHNLMVGHEVRVMADVFNNTNYPNSGLTGKASAAAWNISSTKTIAEVNAGRNSIVARTDMDPDTLVISYATYLALGFNSELRETIGVRYNDSYNTTGLLSTERLATIYDLKQVLVGRKRFNSTPSAATPTMTQTVPDNEAFLCRVGSNANPVAEPCLMRTIGWELEGGILTAEDYLSDEIRSRVMRVLQHVTEHAVNRECGFRITGV